MNNTITVRGIEYTVNTSIYENEIISVVDGVTTILSLSNINIGLPSYLKDVNGIKTEQKKEGKLEVSYTESLHFSDKYVIQTKPIIVSETEDYNEFYIIKPDEFTGSTVHKAGLNSIGKREIGNDDDEVYIFNPIKDFEFFQPIIYNVSTSNISATIEIIDEPLDSELIYSLDGFVTSSPLTSDEITLPVGEHTIGILNITDGFPFSKTINIVEETIDEIIEI